MYKIIKFIVKMFMLICIFLFPELKLLHIAICIYSAVAMYHT